MMAVLGLSAPQLGMASCARLVDGQEKRSGGSAVFSLWVRPYWAWQE
jgi:hypothetical protein